MNGRIVGTKPLYVALAQRKEDRKAHLTSQYMQHMVNMSNMRMPQIGQISYPGSKLEFVFVQVIGSNIYLLYLQFVLIAHKN